MKSVIKLGIVFIFALLVSCNKSESEKPAKPKIYNHETALKADESGVIVKDAWARPGAQYRNSALFFTLENLSSEADTVIGAESNIAELVEVHETYKRENDMMGMRHVERVIIPAHEKFMFKPKSFHVMLIGLTKDIMVNDTINAAIHLSNSGVVRFKAVVTDASPKN